MTRTSETFSGSTSRAASFFDINPDLSKYDVLKTLDALGVKYKIKPGMDVWFSCQHPEHEEKSPSCHIGADIYSKLYGRWHCFGCKRSGTIKDIVSYKDGTYVENTPAEVAKSQKAIVKKIKTNEAQLPAEFFKGRKEKDWNPIYLKYLYGRDITWDQIVFHGIGYCDEGVHQRRVIIPVMLNGKLTTWIGRSIGGSSLRVTSCDGGKPGLFGSELASPGLGPAIVCEGWASALAVERLRIFNVMALQTNQISPEQFEFLRTFSHCIVVPDGDGGGDLLRQSIELYARNMKFYVTQLPEGKDPAEMNPIVLRRRLRASRMWESEGNRREISFAY